MSVTVPFASMWAKYPKPDRESRADLFRSLGWDDLIDNKAYDNTCAIRMSVCLLRCGFSIPHGDLTILKGMLKGKRVKIRFDKLAVHLKAKWGKPEVIQNPTEELLRARGNGVVVFFKLSGGYPGHIDLLQVTRSSYRFLWWTWTSVSSQCGSHCYDCAECWYWPAK